MLEKAINDGVDVTPVSLRIMPTDIKERQEALKRYGKHFGYEYREREQYPGTAELLCKDPVDGQGFYLCNLEADGSIKKGYANYGNELGVGDNDHVYTIEDLDNAIADDEDIFSTAFQDAEHDVALDDDEELAPLPHDATDFDIDAATAAFSNTKKKSKGSKKTIH